MVVLDNMSSKKFLYTPESRASYITESKNFVADSLGKSRNAANEETDGQYVLRLKTTETRNLIDDNVFSLVPPPDLGLRAFFWNVEESC